MKLLITGSAGLIGRFLARALEAKGVEVAGFDLKEPDRDGRPLDTRDPDQVRSHVRDCDGVVHLAAVSRVVWGERDPDMCRSVNVDGTRNLYRAIAETGRKPFVLFGSSREVYGHPANLPVDEDHGLHPCNVYGETKVRGEELTSALAGTGVNAAIFRFSNVFGCTADHVDRVVPAFARQAAERGEIRVEGEDCVFDFTHVDDVVRGLVSAIELLAGGEGLPPIHLVSGIGTSLRQLADMAVRESGGSLRINRMPPRDFDVGRFRGDSARAARLLGWQSEIGLESGFARLVRDFCGEAAGMRESGMAAQRQTVPA